MTELIESIERNMKKLHSVIDKRYRISVKRAEAEYEYRSALGKEMAAHKLDGMAATSLYDYCRGIEYVAALRSKRDVLVAQEDYLEQMMYYYKAEIRIAENQLNAERKGM